MLIRSTWTLVTEDIATLPRSYSLALVKHLHEQMGLSMGNERIPRVSFAGLMGKCVSNEDFLNFQPEEFYELCLCGLEETASKAIASLDLSNYLQFLGTKFKVVNREDEITTYEEIYAKLVSEEPEPVTEFNLQFATPTSFSQDRTHLPLPIPALMLRSWLERWNYFAPVYLGEDELISYLSKAIRIKSHRLQTYNFQIYQGYITGFKGKVILQLPYHVEPLLAHVTDLLVHYGSFAGTGVKTRLGMGKTMISSSL